MDIKTMYVILIGGYVANSLFLLAYLKRGIEENLKLHFISQCLMALAYFVVLSRLVVPEVVSAVAGGIVSFSGLEVEILALAMTLGPVSKRYLSWSVGGAAAAGLAFTVVALTVPDTRVRIVIFTALSAVLVVQPALSYLREAGRSRSMLKAAIGITLLVFLVSFIVRIVDTISQDSGMNVFTPSPAQVFYYAGQILYMLLVGAGLILVSKERTDQKLYHAATRDALTGAFNRGTFQETAWRAISFAMRKDIPFTLMMFDVGDLKRINDKHGHYIGDLVLKDFADSIGSRIRNYDHLGRNGGDEFILLLQSVDSSLIGNVASRLRSHIAMPLPGGISYTVSAGALCVGHPKGMNLTYDRLLVGCDKVLYKAKEAKDGNLLVMGEEALPEEI